MSNFQTKVLPSFYLPDFVEVSVSNEKFIILDTYPFRTFSIPSEMVS